MKFNILLPKAASGFIAMKRDETTHVAKLCRRSPHLALARDLTSIAIALVERASYEVTF
jgi:hypothetical protein